MPTQIDDTNENSATTEDTSPVSTPNPGINVLTSKQFKALKQQRQHFANLSKKREQRWASPYADAKMEDVRLILEKIDDLLYQDGVTRKALINAKLLTLEDFKAVIERDKVRFAKAEELRNNTTMSDDDKKKIAAEYELPLEVIGLAQPME